MKNKKDIYARQDFRDICQAIEDVEKGIWQVSPAYLEEMKRERDELIRIMK